MKHLLIVLVIIFLALMLLAFAQSAQAQTDMTPPTLVIIFAAERRNRWPVFTGRMRVDRAIVWPAPQKDSQNGL